MDFNSWWFNYWLLIPIVLIASAPVMELLEKHQRRLRNIDRKIDLILSHLGIDPDQGIRQQVMELVKTGQNIRAIKLYREMTGAGLKEAKDYVEGLVIS